MRSGSLALALERTQQDSRRGQGRVGLVSPPSTGSSPEQSPRQVGEGGCVVLRTPLSLQGSRDPRLPVPWGGATLRATPRE